MRKRKCPPFVMFGARETANKAIVCGYNNGTFECHICELENADGAIKRGDKMTAEQGKRITGEHVTLMFAHPADLKWFCEILTEQCRTWEERVKKREEEIGK